VLAVAGLVIVISQVVAFHQTPDGGYAPAHAFALKVSVIVATVLILESLRSYRAERSLAKAIAVRGAR